MLMSVGDTTFGFSWWLDIWIRLIDYRWSWVVGLCDDACDSSEGDESRFEISGLGGGWMEVEMGEKCYEWLRMDFGGMVPYGT